MSEIEKFNTEKKYNVDKQNNKLSLGLNFIKQC